MAYTGGTEVSWTYDQRTGALTRDGGYVAYGYSGFGSGKNAPHMQGAKNIGPIPRGFYEIGPPSNSGLRGPHVMRLTPAKENEMFGRSDFLIHGDSKTAPGTASHGCIILPRAIRVAISESGDNQLEVVATEGITKPKEGIAT